MSCVAKQVLALLCKWEYQWMPVHLDSFWTWRTILHVNNESNKCFEVQASFHFAIQHLFYIYADLFHCGIDVAVSKNDW